ncbi:DoxX family membrane protein [Candidatus Woesearchaeota archaeon]|nr:DoxX family membrane protein [Candidatus Woesearchaeota archaeon]
MMTSKQEYGVMLLRYAMAGVFLLFGINQLYAPTEWTGFVPGLVSKLMSASTAVIVNGCFEIIFGLFLLFGLYVRLSSLLLGLHLIGISFSLGYSPLAIRDWGLAMATLALFLMGTDKYCLDVKRTVMKGRRGKAENREETKNEEKS